MTATLEPPAPAEAPEPDPGEAPARPRLWQSLVLPVLAVFTALLIGALVIVFTDPDTLDAWSRFFSDPAAALSSSWSIVTDAYSGLFRSSLGSQRAISETLVASTPLIFTGLSVALAFRAGLFNIGGEGQILIGSAASIWVGFTLTGLPAPLHLTVALVAGFLGGAAWAAIAGALKAWRGAHEVISTIMLNYIALRLVDWMLRSETFRREGRTDPISKIADSGAHLPRIFGSALRANLGFVLALVAAWVVWWLLFRTTVGFRLRVTGANPSAARYAGISVGATWVLAMGIAGGLAGLAGATDVLGVQYSLTGGFTGFGFDGIAVALLGRSHPLGVVLSALLFGVLRAGAVGMQASTSVPVDIIVVIQALVILFVAAPALVRDIYRIKVPEGAESTSFAVGWGK